MFARLCFVWVCIVRLMEPEVGGQGSGSLPAARESCFCFLLFSQLNFLPLTWTGRRIRGVTSEMHSKVCYCRRHTCACKHANSWSWIEDWKTRCACGTWEDCASAHTRALTYHRDMVLDQSWTVMRWGRLYFIQVNTKACDFVEVCISFEIYSRNTGDLNLLYPKHQAVGVFNPGHVLDFYRDQ